MSQWSESEVWLDDFDLWPDLDGILGLDWWSDDNIITRSPVDWSGNSVPVTGLQAVDDTEDLSGVSAGGGWVGEDKTDGLLWVNDEDRADGESNALGVDVGSILVVKHVVGESNLSLLVTNDWERKGATGDLVDILDPSTVGLDGIGRETNQLDTTFGELWLQLGEGTQLGGADWGVVLWVGEEDDPVIANEFMEINGALSGFGLEVWSDASEAESWWFFSRHFEVV